MEVVNSNICPIRLCNLFEPLKDNANGGPARRLSTRRGSLEFQVVRPMLRVTRPSLMLNS